ncbi:hypothetical protein PLICRDRAFT_66300, partial [Plicaturopsis crispa FD-325 SS-3]
LDPHSDTPVEILHVLLLGVVKYFWRDVIKRLKDEDKDILTARLSSFDVSGLCMSPLNAKALVNYSGSLIGRDFRAVVQAAPFVLHGLLPKERIEVWLALSALVPLVWEPQIENVDQHIVRDLSCFRSAIDHLLDCTCRLTPRWFNKPKFHILLHLPDHIRRFGPAILFATE